MKITVLTLFPELFAGVISTSVIARSREKGIVSTEFVQIRDFSTDIHRRVDDTPFGGGAGMVMTCQPLFDALKSVRKENSHVVLLSARGVPYTQKKAHELAKKEHLILLCGHYEGVDERVAGICDEEISVGDYVLTGGEPGAIIIMDSVIRLLTGAIRNESIEEESYENGLLEYPQYTHPAVYEGMAVPEVLLSGHHENIRKWRLLQSLKRTREVRPDLYEAHEFTKEEKKLAMKLEEEEEA
ncbi:MAG: tRNA (guanosine(37)-N1)-methyltransferase TrmD [Solobacterium sp.]|nr:tRNA (guanosine(37)-N1)-methyltransferase TrmD [Solobacterium sp.]